MYHRLNVLPDKKMYEYFCLERMKRLPESPVSALAFANLFFPNLNVCIQHYIVNGSICQFMISLYLIFRVVKYLPPATSCVT